MKRLIFFLLPVIFISACSDFYHLHYKKLDKIPAKGFVAPPEIKSRQFSDRKKIQMKDSVFLKSDSVIPEKSDSKIIFSEKKLNRNYFTAKKSEKKAEKITSTKNKSNLPLKKKRQKIDGSGFLVALLLFLCLLLIIGGGIIFVIGIFVAFWLPILVGLLLMFLGIWPILGFIGFMIGDRYRPVENYQDSDKKFKHSFS